MLNSINIGTTGLTGFSKQLQTISNNVANLNTTGFKGANAQFTALFSAGGDGAASAKAGAQTGYGLGILPSVVDFSQGQINQTGNDLDVAIDGRGFFVLHDSAGQTLYSRDGRFQFDDSGILVNSADARVQGLGVDGALHDISLTGLRANPAQASSNITLTGTLLNEESPKQISNVTVTDSTGGSHALTIELTNNDTVSPGSWLVTIKDGATSVGSGEVRFIDGQLDPAHASIQFSYTPAGAAAMPLTLTLAPDVTALANGSSSLAVSRIDGHAKGELIKTTFDQTGKLILSYSNGQITKGQTLALANPSADSDLEAIGNNSFKNKRPEAATLGVASDGVAAINADALEGSNVDLSNEFSAIIITQRGYQAASELISTANQMLETLMHMKG